MKFPAWLDGKNAIPERELAERTSNWSKWWRLHRKTATEAECLEVIRHELAHKRRPEFIYRVHARFAELRAKREASELYRAASNARD